VLTVGSLEGQCAEMWISAGPPFTIELRPHSSLLPRGSDQTTAYTALCGPNQAVVGFLGRAGTSLDRVAFRCASFDLVGGATPSLQAASMTTVGPFGGSGGQPFEENCAAGTIARGEEGHGVMRIDSLGLHCANAVVPP
jgi:hypothetical protein